MSELTKEEFFQQYADGNNLTVEKLKEMGRDAFPCDCDYEECQGWQIVNREDYLRDLRWREELRKQYERKPI